MAEVYADLIIKGRKTYSEVPAKLKEAVKEVLIRRGHPELMDGPRKSNA